jgi:hypothetical protein
VKTKIPSLSLVVPISLLAAGCFGRTAPPRPAPGADVAHGSSDSPAEPAAGAIEALADWVGYRWQPGLRLTYAFDASEAQPTGTREISGELELVVEEVEPGTVRQLATVRVLGDRPAAPFHLRITRDRAGAVRRLQVAGEGDALVAALLSETQIVLGKSGLLSGRKWMAQERVGRRETRADYEIGRMGHAVEIRKAAADAETRSHATAALDSRFGWLVRVKTVTEVGVSPSGVASTTFSGNLSLIRNDVLGKDALAAYRDRFELLTFSPAGVQRGLADGSGN